jgi:uncharacterized membrane protein YqgA involved in biofilm formation
MIGLGTVINTAAIILGGLIGHFAGRLFKEDQQRSKSDVTANIIIIR